MEGQGFGRTNLSGRGLGKPKRPSIGEWVLDIEIVLIVEDGDGLARILRGFCWSNIGTSVVPAIGRNGDGCEIDLLRHCGWESRMYGAITGPGETSSGSTTMLAMIARMAVCTERREDESLWFRRAQGSRFAALGGFAPNAIFRECLEMEGSINRGVTAVRCSVIRRKERLCARQSRLSLERLKCDDKPVVWWEKEVCEALLSQRPPQVVVDFYG